MAEDFLTKIIKEKQEFVKKQKSKLSEKELQRKSQSIFPRSSFANSLKQSGKISLIAEIKQASPSKGIIREEFNPVDIALIYQDSGVDALSVLTEEKYFRGSADILSQIKEKTKLPVLRKDFIVDTYQIYESNLIGADAILLIAEILSDKQLNEFLSLAGSLKLDCLVEVSNKSDLGKVLKTDAGIIGINNRNLHTFDVDLQTVDKLVPLIPKDKIIVAESGLSDTRQIGALKNLGVNAVLIGEAFLRAKDISAKIKELMGY
ncbi:MAG: indole-3-glycerol phosphate synthase TrpC [Candidatus Omnitrophica bacterium]|nr:indole-3-glycerol phosphate synthase TrpC [Candidatus Omnitrophota bacterium]HOX53875.1 indole-3-glycerol phosphate synthase TrpC [Candidatus Omnitrophota bacterium]